MPFAEAQKRKSKSAFYICVVVLSVAVIALFANAIIRRFSSGNNFAAGNTAIKMLAGGFNCDISLKSNGKEYEMNVAKTKEGDFKMTFVKPSNLSTLSFEKTDDGLKVKFGNLEAAVDASSIPQSSLYNAVATTFESFSKGGITAKKQGSDICLYGKTEAGNFVLTLDEGLRPKSLEIPSLKLNAQFSDFRYI